LALNVQNVTKRYGSFTAVNGVSFEAHPGRIFGFLGTNGAGKTTTMRMMLDIIRPDDGQILWNATPVSEIPRNRFGYLPEERGLYPRMRVQDHLLFLAQLYGAEERTAKATLDEWLERLAIEENRFKKVEELSKGNQQKIQFLAAILHDPEILILDEPFSGLDPVNAGMLKDAFRLMRDRGKTIIFSTHQLNDAQELGHDVAIIHRGNLLIAGEVAKVRRSMGRQFVRFGLEGDSRIEWLDGWRTVRVVRRRQDYVELAVERPDDARAVLAEALRRGEPVTRFEIDDPSLNDIFLDLVGAGHLADDEAEGDAA
jgi:ABC-2 type transport system ATP-binding protein